MKKLFPRVVNVFALLVTAVSLQAQPFTNSFTNPVYDYDSPDPSIIRSQDGTFYCYATACQTRKSKDLIHWQDVQGVFSTPSWNGPGYAVWATDVNFLDDHYLMYYALALWGNGTETGIGVARATNPERFTDVGRMFRSKEIGVHNSIDACYVEEGDAKYLVWGSFHDIYITELTADGLKVKDFNSKTKIAGGAFEGAMIHKRGGYYYLFASVGSCCEGKNSTYRTVVGRSQKLTGPYVNKQGGRMYDNQYTTIISGNDDWAGPGHNSEIITDDNGDDWLLYHAYRAKDDSRGRVLMLDKITWTEDGWPTVNDGHPSSKPMPAPAIYSGDGANMTYRFRNMDLARRSFKKWEIKEDSCTFFVNGTLVGSAHMPMMHAKEGQFCITQTQHDLPNGIYELSLDNFSTNGGVDLLLNDVPTPAHNAALDDTSAPSSRSGIAKRFLNSDDYRQKAYGLVRDGKLSIGIQGNLSTDESYYAADLKLTYREKNAEAAAPLLAYYTSRCPEYINSDSVFYKTYRTRLNRLAQDAAQAEDPYSHLLYIAQTQDSILSSIQVYSTLNQVIKKLEEEIAISISYGVDVESSKNLCAEAQSAYNNQDYSDEQVQELTDRLTAAIHTQAHKFLGGDGTEENPYRIVRPTQLDQMHYVLKTDTMVYFKLEKDIDMAGYEWETLNNQSSKYRYRIDFDGNGHLIRNLTPVDDGYPSFFGTLCGNCRNVGFVNAKVESRRSAVAILAGYVGHSSYKDEQGNAIVCRVENCYFTGEITSSGYVGAVAGVLSNRGNLELRNVYSYVTMTGNGGTANRVGGLVGRVWGTLSVSKSYAAGSIDAPVSGGVIGGGQATTTPPSIYEDVIAWNNELKGQKVSPFGVTAQGDIQTNVYHFQGMLVNGEGTSDGKSTQELYEVVKQWGPAWHSDPAAGNGYPILAWQYARGDYRTECGFSNGSSIQQPSVVVPDGKVHYFNIQGQHLARPHKGVNIIQEKGKNKKVLLP